MTAPGPDVALKRRAAPGPFMGRQDMRGTGIHEPAEALDVIQIPRRLPK